MSLVVVITCPKCGMKKTVYVYEWDIRRVIHTCPDHFVVEFKPERTAF